ncbi:CapA family protein, partial [Blautia faecis]|uniref:CapA family protein n=1 Tax=Blautia faecis TaxID=871665 RepID=UPI001D022D5E
MKADVQKAKEQADVIIVSAHWGDENEAEVTAKQQEYAQLFADLGVDLVIGT